MSSELDEPRLRQLPTAALTGAEVAEIHELLISAFGADAEDEFTEDDWQHALGGLHIVADLNARIVAHASVVPRELHVAGRPMRTGYVEAVATAPEHQRTGIGSQVMRTVGAHIRDRYELGALGTGRHRFYERLGWRTWHGPSSVRTPTGEQWTPDDDGYIMVLATPTSPPLDLDAPISCEWRPGDAW
jgi:aminoglycoside 2'-N-acetyltransferase I